MGIFYRGALVGLLTFILFEIGFLVTHYFLGPEASFWKNFQWDYLIPAAVVILLEGTYFYFYPVKREMVLLGIAFLCFILLLLVANNFMHTL